YVKAGVYDEQITVLKDCRNLLMYGDGPRKTIITGSKNEAKDKIDINHGASFGNDAERFIARDMTFENTAGPDGKQAVALRNLGDMSAFVGCEIKGYQDTLYAQSNRQFYSNCVISGTIDFIFGMSSTLIQDSKIIVRKPKSDQSNVITADGTVDSQYTNTGIVIQGCEIVTDEDLVKSQIRSYLGRPWKPYSRMVFMESTIGDFIHPDGW
ncbi:pectinesterase, partial [Trifolium pratense]